MGKWSPSLNLCQHVWIVQTPTILASNNVMADFEKCSYSNLTSNQTLYKTLSIISYLNGCKEMQLPIVSTCHFRANPKGKPPIKTLQMKTFPTRHNLKCQLHSKLGLCTFHSCSTSLSLSQVRSSSLASPRVIH